jgi:N-alpha-acetyltransferase 30
LVYPLYNPLRVARRLVQMIIQEMMNHGSHEVVIETEYDNYSSLSLYDSFGFIREKRLKRFYSNGKDAYVSLLIILTRTDLG